MKNIIIPQAACLLHLLLAIATLASYPLELSGEALDNKEGPRTGVESSVLAVGDIMLTGSSKKFLQTKGYGHAFRDKGLSKLIMSADVAFANLEYPVTSKGSRYEDKSYTFRGDPESLSAIKGAGFDVLSLANNHIMDYGEKGLRDTLRQCRRIGLACAGAGMDLPSASMPAVIKRKGVTYGLLAYSMTFPEEFWAGSGRPGSAHPDWAQVEQDISDARPKVDILMVSFHWGEELKSDPKKYQVDFARHAISSGADMVLGHHPHIPQGIEIFKGRPIFYSLGNYAFGAMSENAGMSFVALTIFRDHLPVEVKLYPVNVLNREVVFQPKLAKGTPAKRIISHLNELSRKSGTTIRYVNNIGKIVIPHDPHPASSTLTTENH